MFVALRDIGFAKGRFALIGAVVALITLLVGFLTGLTAGLGNQNISSVMNMDADTVVFSQPLDGDRADWNSSKITQEMLKKWQENPDVAKAEPLAIQRAKASATKDAPVVLFGVAASSTVAGEGPSGNGMIRLSRNSAELLDAKSGDMVTIGKKQYTVEQVSEESWYEHSAVIRMTISDLKVYSESIGQPDNFANVILVDTKNSDADLSELNNEAGTVSKSKLLSYTALSTFKSEIGSLGLMIAMLFGISALIIGAFFTVWTIQRKPDIAVLKALGASTNSLVRDTLSQAFIVLFFGISAGILATIGLGTLAGSALPFIITPLTMGIPAVLMLLTGLAGAGFASRSVVTADPLTALNASR
jgi:putative ABC transport system permease protein